MASCREIEFFLILWVISLCFPLLTQIIDVNSSETGILYYLSGYVGYFVLGYYLITYPDRIPFKWLIPAVIIAYAAPVYCKLKSLPVVFYSVFWYLSIFSAIQCAFFLETDSMADQKARKTGRDNVLCQSFQSFFWDLSGSFLHHTRTALELELCN